MWSLDQQYQHHLGDLNCQVLSQRSYRNSGGGVQQALFSTVLSVILMRAYFGEHFTTGYMVSDAVTVPVLMELRVQCGQTSRVYMGLFVA